MRRKMRRKSKKIKTPEGGDRGVSQAALRRSNSGVFIRQRKTADLNNKINHSTRTKQRGRVSNHLVACLGKSWVEVSIISLGVLQT